MSDIPTAIIIGFFLGVGFAVAQRLVDWCAGWLQYRRDRAARIRWSE